MCRLSRFYLKNQVVAKNIVFKPLCDIGSQPYVKIYTVREGTEGNQKKGKQEKCKKAAVRQLISIFRKERQTNN